MTIDPRGAQRVPRQGRRREIVGGQIIAIILSASTRGCQRVSRPVGRIGGPPRGGRIPD
jgi:hypothetical protein